MNISELGENGLIESIRREFSSQTHERLVTGIGDDTSVTLQDGSAYLLTTTDTLVEGTHFSLSFTTPVDLGRKSLSVSLSDIASMGGVPLFFLVSLAIPGTTPAHFIDGLYQGLRSAALDSASILIGGNTTSSAHGLMITTTLLGEVPKGEVVLRSGARDRDRVFVTGVLGSAAMGLRVLKGEKGDRRGGTGGYDEAIRSFLDPVPRLRAGRLLSERGIASSMIDVSDGLVGDAGHIATESRVGIEIEREKVPVSGAIYEVDKSIMEHALNGGEDYELLFTVPEDKINALCDITEELGTTVTEIGRVTGGTGVRVIGGDGSEVELSSTGYEHFKG